MIGGPAGFGGLYDDNGDWVEAAYARPGDQQNKDLFILQPSYHWDTGAASLAMIYLSDQTRGGKDVLIPETTNANSLPEADVYGQADMASLKEFYLNPAFAQSFGDFSVHFEGMFASGKDHAQTGTANKSGGSGLYLDLDYNYGPGNAMLAGWWIEGTKEGADVKAKNMVGSGGTNDIIGGGFQPFIVAYGETRAGRRDSAIGQANTFSAANPLDEGHGNNHWAMALAGSHAFTDAVTLNYAAGYLALNKAASLDVQQARFGKDSTGTDIVPDLSVITAAKKDIGWEVDLGFDIQILDNLKLNTSFGYLVAGKALDYYTATSTDGDIANTTLEKVRAKDAYTWYNTLTFSF
jgi:hypothetical protein